MSFDIGPARGTELSGPASSGQIRGNGVPLPLFGEECRAPNSDDLETEPH